jgi:hypothetical protein
MKSAVAAALSALLLVGTAAPGLAASACAGWSNLALGYKDMNFNDARARQACVYDVREQASRAGYRPVISGDSLFFWFGNDVVAVRCMTRTLVSFAAFHRYDNQACPLQDRIKFSLRLLD